MTIEQKAKAYDEALERAKIWKDKSGMPKDKQGILDDIFPELKESEDERIRKGIIRNLEYLMDRAEGFVKGELKERIAWLEKQGEPKDINPSEFDLRLNKLLKQFETLSKEELASSLSFYLNVVQNDGTYKAEEKQGEQKHVEWHREDEQNLNACLGYIPDEFLRRWLMDVIHVKYDKSADKVEDEEYNGEDYGIDSLYHAQRILEKTLGKVDGYQTDDGILEHKCAISAVKKLYEQKSAEEYNITGIGSKNAQGKLGEMIKNLKPVNEVLEQKPADKVEPKFHKGEWVVWQDKCYKVNYNGCGYELIDQNGLSTSLVYGTIEENAHLWTIKDAKDGDVLCSCQIIVLFKKWEDNTDYNFMIAYAGIDVSNKLQITNKHWLLSNDCKPATKEQRDLLFKKIKESGYEWDAEKKELKKIEQNSTEWSEEDKKKLNRIYMLLAEAADEHAFSTTCRLIGDNECVELQDFLKSLKPQNHWKPTEEQLYMLNWLATNVLDDGVTGKPAKEVLYSLYEQLKQL